MLRTMFRFTKNDFIINKRLFLLNLGLWFIFASWIFRITPLNFFLVFGIVYAVVTAISPMTAEGSMAPALMGAERKIDILYASLPNKRSTIVFARYFTSLVIMLAMVALILSYGLLLNRLMPASPIDFAPIVSIEGVFSLVFLAVLAICIFLPFLYRFGLMGIMIALAAGVVFLTLGVAMTALLKNSAFKDSLIGRAVRSVLSGVFSQMEGSGLPSVLGETISNLGVPLSLVLINLIMIVLFFISFKISLYIFNKKEL